MAVIFVVLRWTDISSKLLFFHSASPAGLAGNTVRLQRKRCQALVKTVHFTLQGWIERSSVSGKALASWKDLERTEQPYPGRSNIICDVHRAINTDKCRLNFASQWYNYVYDQTYAESYYKNAKLLLPVFSLIAEPNDILSDSGEDFAVYYTPELQCKYPTNACSNGY